jgi:hypothetical protein
VIDLKLRAGEPNSPISPTSGFALAAWQIDRQEFLEAQVQFLEAEVRELRAKLSLAEKQRDIAIVNKGYLPPGQTGKVGT